MSKSKQAAKRKREAEIQRNVANKKRPLPSPPSEDASSLSLGAVVSTEEVDVTVDTLRALAAHPAAIKAKACRELRSAVYDFRQACTTGVNTAGPDAADSANLTARISAALVDGKHTDALVLLAEMRIRCRPPKLGALCRWVRDLDVTSGLSMYDAAALPERTGEQVELLRLLDAISRVTGTVEVQHVPVSLEPNPDPIALQPVWDLGDAARERLPIHQSVLDGSIFASSCPENIKDRFRVLERTPGPQRKPPNLHDAVLQLSSDDAVDLSGRPPPPTTHHRHPAVPNLSVMRDVLSPSECRAIVAAMESVGFLPDAPVRDDGAEASVLAHNVYWIVDTSFHDRLWARVAPFVPSAVGGRRVRGINRRFRVYRYVPGAEYRVHFDGAWPPSGVRGVEGHDEGYVWDASPTDAPQSSLFTFLVYLNDDFEGGETTFLTPSLREGVMNAHPVRPVMGSIALFPHGESEGALLHEGTGVRKGAKYIIRTDVEYDVHPAKG